jgi:predicted small lipoprotein YifL
VARAQLINLALHQHHKKQGAQAPCFSVSEEQLFPLDRPMLSKTVRSFLLPLGMTLAVSLVVTGCGRKGAIDPPSTPVELRNKRPADGQEVKQVTPERPFVLDPLL